jgi:hypothetical protein
MVEEGVFFLGVGYAGGGYLRELFDSLFVVIANVFWISANA